MSDRLRVRDRIANTLDQWTQYRIEAPEEATGTFVVVVFLGTEFSSFEPQAQGAANIQNWIIECHDKTTAKANALADAVEYLLAQNGFRTYREGEAKQAEGRFAATVAIQRTV